MKHSIDDFNLISNDTDYDVFCNDSYRQAVNTSINRVLDKYEDNKGIDTKQGDTLFLLCHRSFIEIKDKTNEPTIHLLDFLDSYDA